MIDHFHFINPTSIVINIILVNLIFFIFLICLIYVISAFFFWISHSFFFCRIHLFHHSCFIKSF